MAIYYFESKIISRSQGRSAVAVSANHSCCRLEDERTGLSHDFTKKAPHLVQATVLLPEQAPPEFADRNTLWNTVEAREKRKDSQLCREFSIALPLELTEEQNWALAQVFVQAEFVGKGMIADVAFHRGHKYQEDRPHLYVMLTMRQVTEKGFGLKERSWNARKHLENWRESWADTCNQRFVELGLDMRIDHRTLEAQGIDLEPQTKIGPAIANARLAKFQEHQIIARENGERIIADPLILLKAITAQQSTFTDQDFVRVVKRYTADDKQFQTAYHAAKAHPDVVLLGKDDQGRERYTTQSMLATEKQCVQQTTDRDIDVDLRERHQRAKDKPIKNG